MMLYKTITIEQPAPDGQYEYEDLDLKPGVRYFFQVMARHAGGGFSPLSEVVMVKID